MKIARIVALAALVLGAAALVGVGRPDGAHGKASPSSRTIPVTATGTVEQVPDRAQLGFAVVTRADTAKQALEANSADTRRMVDALERAGIDAKSIQTQDVSLYQDALKDAVRAARAKAAAIAQAAGAEVGTVTNVVESGGAPQPYAYQAARLSASAPNEPGTQKIEADVTVTFAI